MQPKKIYKSLLSLFIIGQLIAVNVYPALAVKIPSANKVAADLEKRYHITTETLRGFGENLNTSSNKSQAPQVSLTFSPANPESGDKITATANPMYFNADPKNLYYTWYLRHPGCEEAAAVTTLNADCDLNGDAKINVEDWKIEAARIMAGNGFDWGRAVYSYADGESGYEARSGGHDRPTNDDLEDAFTDDSDDNLIPHCYIHDFNTGINYELVDKVPDQELNCPSGKTAVCARTETDITFDAADTAASETCKAEAEDEPICSIKDEETASFSCPSTDEVPLCVKDENLTDDDIVFTELTVPGLTVAPTGTPAAGSGSMSNGTYYYVITAVNVAGETIASPQSPAITVTNPASDSVLLDWADVSGAASYKVYRATTAGVYTNTLINSGGCAPASLTASTCSDTAASTSTGTPPAVNPTVAVSDSCENIDDNADISLTSGSDTLTYTYPWKIDADIPATDENPIEDVTCSADRTNDDVDFICNPEFNDGNSQHLFASRSVSSRYASGDGVFTAAEEQFFRTDPGSASTAQNGNKDEANVVGLGQTTFSWNYQNGDQVGVAVEGTSATPTKYDDSSLMIMWALTKNKCALEATGIYTKKIPEEKGYDVEIPVTSITDDEDGQKETCIGGNCLNDCLADNLVDPKGDQHSLNVSLSYAPENPINDPSGISGDEVSVSASIVNAQNRDFINYQWEVYSGSSVNPPAGWGSPLLKNTLFPEGDGQTSGIGLSTFKFKLNFQNPNPYLRVRVTAAEQSNSGSAEVIIPVTSTSAKIRVFSTDTGSDSPLRLIKDTFADPGRCDSGISNVLCPVIKNEIVGLQVDSAGDQLRNILWTIDDKPVQPINKDCDYSTNPDCDMDKATGEATGTAYFPVLKAIGEQYSVNLTADTNAGKKISLTKTFKVTDPEVKILSDFHLYNTDPKKLCDSTYTACPVLLGNYVDLDDNRWPDYSETSFDGITNSTITLTPSNAFSAQNLEWYIDGVEATSLGAVVDENTRALSFTAYKQPGESYSISVGGVYTQKSSIKKILNRSFDVRLDEFYEKPVGSSVELRMVESFDGTTSAQAPLGRKILASLVTDVPAYISFLFRVVLTTLLLLFTSGILMSLSPKREN